MTKLENLAKLEELGIPNYSDKDRFDKSYGQGSLDSQHRATYYRSKEHEKFLASIIGINDEDLVDMGIGVESEENDTAITKAMHELTKESGAAHNSSDAPELIHVLDTIAAIQKRRAELLESALKLKTSGPQSAFPVFSTFRGKQSPGQFFRRSDK